MALNSTNIKVKLRYPTVVLTPQPAGTLSIGTILASNGIVIGNTLTINSTSFSGTAASSLTVGSLSQANIESYITSNSTTAYANAISFAANASNANTGTLAYARLPSGIVNTSADFTISGVHTLQANLIFGSSSVIIANGSFGSAGQVLASNGTGLYWRSISSGLVAGDGLTSNVTHYAVNPNTGITVNSSGVFVNSSYIATLSSNNSTYLNGQLASYYTNATNISTGTLDTARLPATINVATAINVGNVNLTTNIISIGNTTVNTTINATSFSGIANNANNLGGVSLVTLQGQITGNAATAYSNAVANAAAIYQTSAGLAANVLVLSANAAGFLGNSSGTLANISSWVTGNAATAYTNATTFASNATNLTTGTLSNARLATQVVNTSGVFTLSGIIDHTANLVLTGNTSATLIVGNNSTTNVIVNSTALLVQGTSIVGYSFANSTIISVGNTTVNTSINSTSFSGTANNSTNFGGLSLVTLQGQITGNAATAYSNAVANAAAIYQTTAGLSANVLVLTSNATGFLGNSSGTLANIASWVTGNAATAYSNATTFSSNATNLTSGTVGTARLGTGTANSTTVLYGNGVWAAVTGGSANPAGTNTQIQFNDSGVFGATSDYTFDKIAVRLNIGNSTVNTTINSTAIVLKSLVANGTIGTSGQILTSNGTGLYWSTPTGGGLLAGNGLTSNASHYAVLANTGIIANSTGTFLDTTYTATLTVNAAGFLGNSSGTLANISSWVTGNAATAYSNAVANAAAIYQTTAGLSANVLVLSANAAGFLGNSSGTLANIASWITGNAATAYSNSTTFSSNATNLTSGTVATARLASGTANSTTYLRGDQTWATVTGGSANPAGSNTEIQFNDSGVFGSSSNYTFDKVAIKLSIGNTTVNTSINSSSLSVIGILAGGTLGSSGQVLTSNGSAVYWNNPTGGSSSEIVTSISTNTTAAAPTTFYIATGTINITLPTAVGNSGLKFQIKNNGTGIITVLPQSGQLINGDINMIMTEKNTVLGFISDGTGWNVF